MISLAFVLTSYSMICISIMNFIILFEMEIMDSGFLWLTGIGIGINLLSPWRDAAIHAILCCLPALCPSAGTFVYAIFGILLLKVLLNYK